MSQYWFRWLRKAGLGHLDVYPGAALIAWSQGPENPIHAAHRTTRNDLALELTR